MKPEVVDAGRLLAVMEEEFRQGKALSLTVTGSSMEPFLRHLRDQAILVPPEKRPPRRGEIIFFRRNGGGCVLHRVVGRTENGCVVCGDAQTWTEQVREEQILAVAEALVRKGRMIPCGSRRYRVCVWLWMLARPFRKPFFALGRLAGRWQGEK